MSKHCTADAESRESCAGTGVFFKTPQRRKQSLDLRATMTAAGLGTRSASLQLPSLCRQRLRWYTPKRPADERKPVAGPTGNKPETGDGPRDHEAATGNGESPGLGNPETQDGHREV